MATRKRALPAVKYVDVPDSRGYKYAIVDIDRLVPDPENPRIPGQESALETILALIEEDGEGLLNLARDIVDMKGYNPAELLSVSPLDDELFVVKEGNRRIAARRLLRNPEQLKDHVSGAELARWRALSNENGAKSLPTTSFVVVGDDHEAWVDRRHLGPQSGVGLVSWDTKMKARRDSLRHGTTDRAAILLDGLKAKDPDTFTALEPPKRTYTTFQRLLDSQPARAHIGIDVNEKEHPVLTKGKRSLKLLEQVLRDLRATGRDKLTSRTIHDRQAIAAYLSNLDGRMGAVESTDAIVLKEGAGVAKSRKTATARSASRVSDVMKSLTRPKAPRPGKLYDELVKARRREMANAALVLTRILLELSIDHYATEKNLSTGSDVDAVVQADVKAFRTAVGRAGVKIPKSISQALYRAANQPPNLDKKLANVIDALVAAGQMNRKEAAAKKRELRDKEVVALLHDAVHRLETVPSLPRVTHILEVVAPIFNGMEAPRP